MKLIQHYSDITTANAIGGTFAKLLKPIQKPSFAKEPPSQHTTKRHEMTRKRLLKKKGEGITAVTVAQLLFLENSFQKHKILTSLEAILERFVFKILKFRALIMVFFHVVQYGFYTSFSIYE